MQGEDNHNDENLFPYLLPQRVSCSTVVSDTSVVRNRFSKLKVIPSQTRMSGKSRHSGHVKASVAPKSSRSKKESHAKRKFL